jgi:hypothetical protein
VDVKSTMPTNLELRRMSVSPIDFIRKSTNIYMNNIRECFSSCTCCRSSTILVKKHSLSGMSATDGGASSSSRSFITMLAIESRSMSSSSRSSPVSGPCLVGSRLLVIPPETAGVELAGELVEGACSSEVPPELEWRVVKRLAGAGEELPEEAANIVSSVRSRRDVRTRCWGRDFWDCRTARVAGIESVVALAC